MKLNILYKDNQIERIIQIDFNFDQFLINRIQNSKKKKKKKNENSI